MIEEKKMNIQMVDLKSQYANIKPQIDKVISEVLDSAQFINGDHVKSFQKELAEYLNVKHVITCANGTDALQIAMMGLGLKPGDEVITPSYTYIATTEVIGLLGLKPVFVDCDTNTFNISVEQIKKAITKNTKAIVPVHLFGQSCDMKSILKLAKEYNLFIIEDNAQGIGAEYAFSSGLKQKTGTIGDIGCTSFFPSKNLGCFGDGGALCTNSDDLAVKIRMIANHGQSKKYHHDVVGCNSRLDNLQAGVLRIKLRELDGYIYARQQAASFYNAAFKENEKIEIPFQSEYSSHVFHQYTIKLKDVNRDMLHEFLKDKNIPSMIYYPIPAHRQEMFAHFNLACELPQTDQLTHQVLSLPMHTELEQDQLDYITQEVLKFVN